MNSRAVKHIAGVLVFLLIEYLITLLLEWGFIQARVIRQILVYVTMLGPAWVYYNYITVLNKNK